MKLNNKAKKNFAEDNEFYINIGKKIKEARLKKYNQFTGKQVKVSQVTVGAALKTTYQQIAKYEKGENRIPLVNLVKISKFLKKPLSFFLENYNYPDKTADDFNIAFNKEVEIMMEQE